MRSRWLRRTRGAGGERLRHTLPALIAVALYAGAALSVFPLTGGGGLHHGRIDNLLTLFTFEWTRTALFTAPGRLFDGLAYHPYPGSLFYTHLMLGGLPIYVPLATAIGPGAAFAALTIATPILNATATYVAVRIWLGRWWPAFIAGLVFGYATLPLHFSQFPHLAMFWWTPIALAFWFSFLKRAAWWKFAGAWAAVFIQFATGVYLGFFATLLLAALIVAAAVGGRIPWREPRLLVGAAVGTLAVAVPFVPLLIGYVDFWLEHAEVRSLDEARVLAARLPAYIGWANFDQLWYQALTPRIGAASIGFPGMTPLVVAAAGLAVGIRRRDTRGPAIALGLAAALFFVLSLGPELHWHDQRTGVVLPYAWLHAVVPGFASMRNPTFFTLGLMAAAALLAALAIDQLFRGARSRSVRRHAASAIVVVVLAAEFARTPVPVGEIPDDPELRSGLAALPAAPVVFIPVGAEFRTPAPNMRRLWWSQQSSGARLVNGYSGYEPRGFRYLARMLDLATAGTQRGAIEALAALEVRTFGLDRRYATDIQAFGWDRAFTELDPQVQRREAGGTILYRVNRVFDEPRTGWGDVGVRLVVRSAPAGASVVIPVTLRNGSDAAWVPPPGRTARAAEVRWRRGDGTDERIEAVTLRVPPVIEPNGTAQALGPLVASVPSAAGDYEVTLVVDGSVVARSAVTVYAGGAATEALAAELTVHTPRVCVRSGERAVVQVTGINSGAAPWLSEHRLGARWSVPDGRFSAEDLDALGWGRHTIPFDAPASPWIPVESGMGFVFEGPLPTPQEPGAYTVTVEMLEEGVRWFGDAAEIAVLVVASNSDATACDELMGV